MQPQPLEPVPCLRCGTFVPAEQSLGSRLAICRNCAPPLTRVPRDPLINWPPHWVMARRALVIGALAAVAAGSGLFRALLSAYQWLRPGLEAAQIPLALLPSALALLVVLNVLLTLAWLPHGLGRWKDELVDRLGFARNRASSFVQVLYCRRAPRLTDVRNPVENGLLAAGPRGLAFFGETSTRLAFRAQRIAGCRLKTLYMLFPPRTALEVTLSDGSTHLFAPLERGSHDENRALAAELGALYLPGGRLPR